MHHLKSSRLSFHANALNGICASHEAYSHDMYVCCSQHFSLALVSNFCVLCIFIAQYPATSTFARTHSTLTQAQPKQADTHWANTTITAPGTSLVAAITNSCLTAWLKMQPQPQPPLQPITRQSVSLNLKPKPNPYPNLDPVKLLLWLLLYLMLAFAAYRLKGVHPWRRRQAGWWSGSQCRACVPGHARPAPSLRPGRGQRKAGTAGSAPAPAPVPVNGVRCHCVSVWVGNLYSFFTGPAACNGNLSAHLLMRLALLCGLVGNVKLIYNFPASHFNFSCCQHASCLLYHFAFCIFSLPDSIPLVRTGRRPTKLIFPCPGWILQAISTVWVTRGFYDCLRF